MLYIGDDTVSSGVPTLARPRMPPSPEGRTLTRAETVGPRLVRNQVVAEQARKPSVDEADTQPQATEKPMTADDMDYRRSRTNKIGDGIKKFKDEVKPLTDLLPFVVKMAAFIGGALLIAYASKEHFFTIFHQFHS